MITVNLFQEGATAKRLIEAAERRQWRRVGALSKVLCAMKSKREDKPGEAWDDYRAMSWIRDQPTLPADEPGVYVAAGYSPLVKIGLSTKSMTERVASMRTACPGIRVIGVLSTDVYDENSMHKRFAKLRVDGEWFRINQELWSMIVNTRTWRRKMQERERLGL